ncbi:GNAT family N-acetyltransferase [Methanolobus sediminis]|uniref:GNAT family N-acetyltransferase n=1 Tax=Methanolobus sediminis TaxID=3072978 RepID=A0AA51UN24_9EURY|nr:GNAT family N-acetyltransferase [Methanolobus sediminis]WMW26073.1 GNAT family N-acetyltransferase [Methanolobus sediminis]
MNSKYSIRIASKNDEKKVTSFIELVDKDFYPPLSQRSGGIPERVERCLDTDEANFLVVEPNVNRENSQSEGFIGMLGYTKNWKGQDTAYINFLATHPDYRNLGISKALYMQLEKKLAESGIKRIYLCTWSGNPAAIKFYESIGYYRYAVVLNDRGNGVNTIYYKKVLI